jgi:hypothetical protein
LSKSWIPHFQCLSFKNKPAARVGFADGDLEDDLPELIGKISFVLARFMAKWIELAVPIISLVSD